MQTCAVVVVVVVTDDTVTVAWNASSDNSGKIHAYIATPVTVTVFADENLCGP